MLLFLGAIHLQAQSGFSDAEYRKRPHWIQMMDEEHPNFFEIQKAFQLYWEQHTMPEGEGDMDVKKKESNKKRFSKRDIREAREEAAMRMAIKKYHWWVLKMEPYVQEDGSIKRQ